MESSISNSQFTNTESTSVDAIGTESMYRLEQVSDTDLLTGTRRLVGRSNQVLAALLAHLAEVEARGIHRNRACSSLYLYCVFELRLSEDAAFRRARVARLARQFPVILQQVADGELHLTALVLLAPHLTEENHRNLLALAKHRTKREVLRIVRTLAPEPAVPDRVELLGPENIGVAVPRAPSWRNLVESLAPAVRELAPGDRPKDWTDRGSDAMADPEQQELQSTAGAAEHGENEPALVPADRYKVLFTVSQEYVDLLERAQDLLSHAVPDRSLAEVHLRALRLLVKRLESRKYGAPAQARVGLCREAAENVEPAAPSSAAPSPHALSLDDSKGSKNRTQTPRQRVQRGQRGGPSRSGAAPVRREVWDRDGGRCTYVDDSGQRCRETRFLELHHLLAHALDGESDASNLTIRCRAHNALAAEQDFGREFMESRSRKLRS